MENHVNHVNENVSVPKWKFRENMHKRKVQSIWYSNKFFRKNEYYSYLKIRPNTESSILFGDQLFERTNSSNYSLELWFGWAFILAPNFLLLASLELFVETPSWPDTFQVMGAKFPLIHTDSTYLIIEIAKCLCLPWSFLAIMYRFLMPSFSRLSGT